MEQHIGYARVSTDGQNLDLQLDSLNKAGTTDTHIYSDTTSGKGAIRERTRTGLLTTRARGRTSGRKPEINENQIKEIRKQAKSEDIPISKIFELYGVSRTTIYKVAPVTGALD